MWLKDHLYEHRRYEFFTSSVKISNGFVLDRSVADPSEVRISCETSLPSLSPRAAASSARGDKLALRVRELRWPPAVVRRSLGWRWIDEVPGGGK
jgi:hypothetical protein